jgi:hypothetical protein
MSAVVPGIVMSKKTTEANAATVRDLTLSIWTGRININNLIEVNARGMATAETTLNLDILHC